MAEAVDGHERQHQCDKIVIADRIHPEYRLSLSTIYLLDLDAEYHHRRRPTAT